jgi:putative N6-adenine-specific DNA methylase
MSQRYTIVCPCLFGLESVLSGEIRRLGGDRVQVTDGKVSFEGDLEMIAKANLGLRTAERVLLELGSFPATSFTELFDRTVQLPLEEFVGKNDAFPVKGYSLNSQLHSVPDCQSIIKKAFVKRLERVYGISWFEESGPVHQIQFSIFKDQVSILLDTSGAGLHKRGYRGTSVEAPIKETLAAGIIDLAHIRRDNLVIDPFCGSGTFLVEAALHACQIAPGLKRHFAAEQWDCFPKEVFDRQRKEAFEHIARDAGFRGIGSDIDPQAVALAAANAQKAGVSKRIRFEEKDIRQFTIPDAPATVLCNPPYGERLLDVKEAEELYRIMGEVFLPDRGCNYYIISPQEEFERCFGRKATKRRKLYNGMIRCQLFMYY